MLSYIFIRSFSECVESSSSGHLDVHNALLPKVRHRGRGRARPRELAQSAEWHTACANEAGAGVTKMQHTGVHTVGQAWAMHPIHEFLRRRAEWQLRSLQRDLKLRTQRKDSLGCSSCRRVLGPSTSSIRRLNGLSRPILPVSSHSAPNRVLANLVRWRANIRM
jgi:hypothetical protein